jgi:putative oxygen-independent coproporphyrinogen III oxidase
MLNLIHPPPLSLYIHYPWCIKKCPYCDFNSHQHKTNSNQNKQYIDILIDDLEHELPSIWGRSIHSVFIGGGTPSLFEPAELDYLLCQLKSRLTIIPTTEITLEANPGSVDYNKFAEFKDLGINRLSIGIQSFNDQQLKLLGRIHNCSEGINAVENAHKANFDQINLDLMFSLPQQTLKQAKSDLDQAISLCPQHISYYQLTIEQNTLFASHPPPLPTDELSYQISQQGYQQLMKQGFEQYEISAWSKAGKQCKHNLNYWHFGDYLGIGAGAHGKITSVSEQSIYRNWKLKQPKQYLSSSSTNYLGGSKKITEADLIFEFMLNTSRLTKGFHKDLFTQTTGLAWEKLLPKLNLAMEQQLIKQESNIISPTALGFTYLNNLQELFL